jgi:hypothetical protein
VEEFRPPWKFLGKKKSLLLLLEEIFGTPFFNVADKSRPLIASDKTNRAKTETATHKATPPLPAAPCCFVAEAAAAGARY